jgi:hypothetical protein
MGCCGKKPIRAPAWTPTPEFNQPTFLRQGENLECYTARQGSIDGNQAGGQLPENKIITPSIVPDCFMTVNQQFKVSGPRVATSWAMPSGSISGLTFNTSTGTLTGTFDPLLEGRTFNIEIEAYDSSGLIDKRTYTVVPKRCTNDDLKFIHPLPGSILTSPFGPRARPTPRASDVHKGCDFAYSGGIIKDVVAACDGEVISVGQSGGYGNRVIIRHKNASGKHMCDTLYAHLQSIYVSVGQKVAAGTPIGKEGNTGVGTGPHLHFEIIKAGGSNIDPLPYIRGQVMISDAGINTYGERDPGQPSGPVTSQTNTNNALTTATVSNTPCPVFNPPLLPSTPDTTPMPQRQIVSSNPNRRAQCAPQTTPDLSTVKAQIDSVLDQYPELDASDRKFIHAVAQIESEYDPYAKNPNSTATGLYQFLDGTAKKFYKGGPFAPPALANIEFNCENRCDPVYATHAMVAWYKKEILPGYNSYIASGKTRINGVNIVSNSVTAKYSSLTKMEWCYAYHHAGFSNMIKGTDTQGIEYIQKRNTAFV